ncbi:hypothetical protein MVEN_00038000 [Mycena venus]|uniref:Uncharacterized protein n=1 Tax=Mycena venus TaxID=2733690 RepID=A0A8H6Z3T9_9AGAR|nr:hypothetical protein MVEN_00038000 [Mycena venus]
MPFMLSRRVKLAAQRHGAKQRHALRPSSSSIVLPIPSSLRALPDMDPYTTPNGNKYVECGSQLAVKIAKSGDMPNSRYIRCANLHPPSSTNVSLSDCSFTDYGSYNEW